MLCLSYAITKTAIKIYEPILHWPMLKYATTKNEPKQPKKNKTSQNKPKGDLKRAKTSQNNPTPVTASQMDTLNEPKLARTTQNEPQ